MIGQRAGATNADTRQDDQYDSLFDDFGGIDMDGNELLPTAQVEPSMPSDWITEVTGLHLTATTSVCSVAHQASMDCGPF